MHNNFGKISVIIPSYNCAQYLGRSIESVLRQTCKPYELIIVDDGSTDDTPDVLSKYKNQIITIRQQNAGASVARNTGIEKACGDWIAFLDADDQWLPSKLEMQINHLEKNPAFVWTYSNYWFVELQNTSRRKAFTSPPPSLNDEAISDYLLVHARYCIRTSTLMVKKEVLFETGLFVPGLKWEDTDIFFKIAYRHPTVGYIHCPLAIYQSDSIDSLTSKDLFYADKRCELIERHLELSRHYHRHQEFIKCAAEKITYWITVALRYHHFKDARTMLRRFWHLLPSSRKWQFALKVYIPVRIRWRPKSWSSLKRFIRRFMVKS